MPAEMTLDDVYDMAIEIEADTSSFYRSAASACPNPQNSQIFKELAEMEADHKLVFAAMKDRSSRHPHIDQAQELSLVANLFATGVQEDLAERFTGLETASEILSKAIDFEKDTIVFYLSMKGLLEDASDKSKVDEIIAEELGHIITLSGSMAKLAGASTSATPARPGLDEAEGPSA